MSKNLRNKKRSFHESYDGTFILKSGMPGGYGFMAAYILYYFIYIYNYRYIKVCVYIHVPIHQDGSGSQGRVW